jgi:hypothetical protein
MGQYPEPSKNRAKSYDRKCASAKHHTSITKTNKTLKKSENIKELHLRYAQSALQCKEQSQTQLGAILQTRNQERLGGMHSLKQGFEYISATLRYNFNRCHK